MKAECAGGSSTPPVVTFAEAANLGASELGAKATNLGWLAREGFAVPPGLVVTPAAGERWEEARGHLLEAARTKPVPPDAILVGEPASPGRASGVIRIVHGPEDFGGFRDGEVLVARLTTPAWTPLFARAAAVVTDGGTLAAHASLVAREYGIPAVVGTGDATLRLRNGQAVTVDGGAGTVELDG